MNLNSTIEGSWNERTSITLTDEQKKLLASTATTDADAKAELLKTLITTTPVTDATVIGVANAVYNKNKPVLKDTDVYQLIAVDVSIVDNTAKSGIINCRVNGEHQQVRF